MQTELFIAIFNQSILFISDDWKEKYAQLLRQEHWNKLAEKVFLFAFEDKMEQHSLPIFNEEIRIDYAPHYQYIEPLKRLKGKSETEDAQSIATVIEATPIASLLLILGQRKTSATLTDENGIPPLSEQLLESCFMPYNDQISKATRAREKHISRNTTDLFWGNIKGNPAEKDHVTKSIVEKIIREKTWWNVFTHYKHGVVYEVRIASGEGIRWKKEDLELIGFLEPFI